MAVSDEARHGRAKAMPVSVEARPARTKATPVSDNRVAGLRAPTATPAGTYVPTPQKTRMQFDDANFQEQPETLKYQRSQFKI